MAIWKKKEYEIGDTVEFTRRRSTQKGMIIKRKRVKSGYTYVVSVNEGGLVGPVYVADINGCVRSMNGDQDVACR